MLSYGLKCKSSSTDIAQNKTSYQVSNHRNCIHTKLNFECFPFTQSLNFQACILIYCLSDLHPRMLTNEECSRDCRTGTHIEKE